MKILTQNDFPLHEDTAVAIGLFDGVHLGHKALVDDILNCGRNKSTIYTFDAKPSADEHIFTEPEKQYIFDSVGIEYYYSRKFDRSFSSLAPEEFISHIVHALNIKHITVGYDFRFGKDAAGDVGVLKQLSSKYGYSLHIVPEVDIDGYKVSSSIVRERVRKGEMHETMRLLGRYYFVDGYIEKGAHIGSKIGFPTANITTPKLLPAHGVYATLALADGKLMRAVSNVGTKPTVKQDDIVNIETFILDFKGNIYGESIRVFFIEMLRPEKRFESIEKMKVQIAADSTAAKEKLLDLEVYKPYLLC